MKGGYTELKICAGGYKAAGLNGCLEDLYKRRPCAYLEGKPKYECLCSFRPDGMYRDPYDDSCNGIFTCKGWQLVEKSSCGGGKVGGDFS